MKLEYIPRIGESFVAELYCYNCKGYHPHVVMSDGIDFVQQKVYINFEASCSKCSCELEELNEKQFRIKEVHKKWNDSMSLAKWRNMIAGLNGF